MAGDTEATFVLSLDDEPEVEKTAENTFEVCISLPDDAPEVKSGSMDLEQQLIWCKSRKCDLQSMYATEPNYVTPFPFIFSHMLEQNLTRYVTIFSVPNLLGILVCLFYTDKLTGHVKGYYECLRLCTRNWILSEGTTINFIVLFHYFSYLIL